MSATEYIGGKMYHLPKAAEMLEISRPRLSQLCIEHGLGRVIAGAKWLTMAEIRQLRRRPDKRARGAGGNRWKKKKKQA